MPNKIKIALTLVVIVAMFLVYQLAQYVHTIANGNSTFQQSSPLPSPDDDPDHDGLNNQQEVIWGSDPFNPDSDGDGFKDGEEVNSGHNPLVPGPNDLINQDNLTQQFSELTVSGLYSGDLNPESTNYSRALSDISISITDSGKYLFNKQIFDSELNVIKSDRASDLLYIQKISPLMREFQELLAQEYENLISHLNIIGVKGFSDSTVQKFFSSQTSLFSDLNQEVINMPVPESFKENHANFINLIQKIHDINNSVVHGDTDPVKASVALNVVDEIYQNYVDLLTDYKKTAQTRNTDIRLLDEIF